MQLQIKSGGNDWCETDEFETDYHGWFSGTQTSASAYHTYLTDRLGNCLKYVIANGTAEVRVISKDDNDIQISKYSIIDIKITFFIINNLEKSPK